jgi:hypothetical protein
MALGHRSIRSWSSNRDSCCHTPHSKLNREDKERATRQTDALAPRTRRAPWSRAARDHERR